MKIVNCYFTGSGETKKVSEFYQSFFTDSFLLDLSNPFVLRVAQTIEADLLILSFPVYSQNIPLPVRKFLPYLFPKHVVINITYGQISPGNVLKEMETYFHQKG